MKAIFKVFLVSIHVLSISCGTEKKLSGENAASTSSPSTSTVTNNAAETTTSSGYSTLVGTVADLPKCDAPKRGSLAYVSNEKKFFSCENDSWMPVEIKGESGKNSLVKISAEGAGTYCAAGGKKIEIGIDTNGNGTLDTEELKDTKYVCDGKNGIDNRIVSSIGCSGSLEGTALNFTYNAQLMASGDIHASASISDSILEVSGTVFFSSKQVGAATAPVMFTNDFASPANGGYWKLSLDRSSLVTTIEYNDINVAGGKRSWTMVPSKCVVNTY
jgi:hypothetical protein